MMTVNSMTRDELRARAEGIRARITKTVEDIVDAGRELLAVKNSISRDQFIKWVEDEVGISQSTEGSKLSWGSK
jgi:hypothetical protein